MPEETPRSGMARAQDCNELVVRMAWLSARPCYLKKDLGFGEVGLGGWMACEGGREGAGWVDR